VRRSAGWRPFPDAPHLFVHDEAGGEALWTEALGRPPDVYGERVAVFEDRTLRRWEAGRSKLAAAILRGYEGPVPVPSERWLYLGAASGTTASHVADLVGEEGSVFAVEKSLRPAVRLLRLAERYPNLFPILADARRPDEYAGDVSICDGIYADIAQADQVDIALANARRFLRRDGLVLIALKTASMGREKEPAGHLAAAKARLEPVLDLERPVPLDPFHRRHYLLAGRPTKGLYRSPRSPERDGPPRAERRR
jgi:fibrillarin-like pre-rRNA processing protein